MINFQFQTEKVKNLKEHAVNMEHDARFLYWELCDVVLELLSAEGMRQTEKLA
ncbi:hypothetical protein LCGC14_2731650, partial [marine sediment metagenome]